MTSVGTFEAKTHLSDLLKQVEQGARITITRHGVPIAQLVPIADAHAVGADEAIAAIRALRVGVKGRVAAETIKAWIEGGRE